MLRPAGHLAGRCPLPGGFRRRGVRAVQQITNASSPVYTNAGQAVAPSPRHKERFMYIGLGTLIVIIIIVLLIRR